MTRNEAIECLRNKKHCKDCKYYQVMTDNTIDLTCWDEAHEMAIEALERKHGEWLETSESIGWEEVGCAECSVCGKTLVLGDYTMDDIKFNYNYCPNCGSEMRGDEDER